MTSPINIWFKYDSGQKVYYTPQVRPHLELDRTYYVTETPALTTLPSVISRHSLCLLVKRSTSQTNWANVQLYSQKLFFCHIKQPITMLWRQLKFVNIRKEAIISRCSVNKMYCIPGINVMCMLTL